MKSGLTILGRMKLLPSIVLRAAPAVAVVAALALAAVPAAASASAVPTSPSAFDFADCPPLPAGMDPHTWRCEVHLATGSITIGRVTIPNLRLTLTHAEGPLPGGESGQSFGVLHARPVAVPGHPRMTARVRYGGYADLIGNGPDPGGLYLVLALHGPGLGPDCTIGTLADPIRTHAARVGDTTTIPTDPPIKAFTLQDKHFTVPASAGCHDRNRSVDTRFGLPSASGNEMTLNAAYTYRMYDSLGG
jgi:hypothetical protein